MKVSNSPSQSNTKENYDKNYEFVCGGRTLILKKKWKILYMLFRLCLVTVKYFPENKYFPEMLFSRKENIFKCLIIL